MDLSIIVPIYNMEIYLEKCLSTLLNQKNSIYSYEVICINDGSTDGSQEILDIYEKRYSNIIKVIVTEKLGVSNARNIGIENSVGEYITFVDSDDWVGEEFVEFALKGIKEENSDLCVFDMLYVDGKEIYHQERVSDTIFNTENHACGKVFKRDLINKYKIKFPLGITIGEDLAFTFSYICAIENYKYIPRGIYYYRKSREGSAMTSKIKEKYKEVNDACIFVYDFAQSHNLLEKNYSGIEYIFIKNIIIRNTMKIIKNNRNLFGICEEVQEQISFVENNFKSWKENRFVINDSDGYLSLKLGNNYMSVLSSINCNIIKAGLYFAVGKFLFKGEKNEYKK